MQQAIIVANYSFIACKSLSVMSFHMALRLGADIIASGSEGAFTG